MLKVLYYRHQFTNTSWGYQGAPNKGTVENKDITEEMISGEYYRQRFKVSKF